MPKNNSVIVQFCAVSNGEVELPEEVSVEQAAFTRKSGDLVIESDGHSAVYVRNFFTTSPLPTLCPASGRKLPGNVAAAFVTLSPIARSALTDVRAKV